SSSVITSISLLPACLTASMKPSRVSMPRPAPPPDNVVIMPIFTGSARARLETLMPSISVAAETSAFILKVPIVRLCPTPRTHLLISPPEILFGITAERYFRYLPHLQKNVHCRSGTLPFFPVSAGRSCGPRLLQPEALDLARFRLRQRIGEDDGARVFVRGNRAFHVLLEQLRHRSA